MTSWHPRWLHADSATTRSEYFTGDRFSNEFVERRRVECVTLPGSHRAISH